MKVAFYRAYSVNSIVVKPVMVMRSEQNEQMKTFSESPSVLEYAVYNSDYQPVVREKLYVKIKIVVVLIKLCSDAKTGCNIVNPTFPMSST